MKLCVYIQNLMKDAADIQTHKFFTVDSNLGKRLDINNTKQTCFITKFACFHIHM